jgi:hypothetical protein
MMALPTWGMSTSVAHEMLSDLSGRCRYEGAFFPNAKRFVVSGGKFMSVTNIHEPAPRAPPGEVEHIRSA